MDVVIHAGMPKTGTTALQNALRAHRGALADHGVCVPDVDASRLLGAIVRDFETLPRPLRHWFPGAGDFRKAQADAIGILRECVEGGWSRLVLSSEYLYGASAAGLQRLVRALPGATRLSCVFYVRSPASFYLASLQQRARASGSVMTPGDFLADRVPAEFRYRPLAFIELCRRALTPNIEVCRYERTHLEGGDIRSDFWRRAGLDTALLTGEEPGEDNAALSPEAVKLLLEYRRQWHPRKLDDTFLPHGTVLLSCLRDQQGRAALKPGVGAVIAAGRRSALEGLRDEHGIVFADVDYGFPETAMPWGDGEPVLDDLIDVDPQRYEALVLSVIHTLLDRAVRRAARDNQPG